MRRSVAWKRSGNAPVVLEVLGVPDRHFDADFRLISADRSTDVPRIAVPNQLLASLAFAARLIVPRKSRVKPNSPKPTVISPSS
jgi:hypothetical protein